MHMPDNQELTIVSNRLPIVMDFDEHTCQWAGKPGAGGLVSAMNPILQQRGGTWVGWPGMVAEKAAGHQDHLDGVIDEIGHQAGYKLDPVMLSEDEVDGYYGGFANSVLWPLFHGFPNRCDFNPDFWNQYEAVNEKFAAALANTVSADQPIWVHDYHLIGVAEKLRDITSTGNIGYFLHIPFPALENYTKLPWRAELMRGLLAYDLLGFQSGRDKRNFLECVARLMPDATITHSGATSRVVVQGNEVSVGVFPISIDFEDFDQRARSADVQSRIERMRDELGPYKVLLGIDRLDYTKGLIERFEAFEHLLRVHPELCEEVVFFQLVVPSRESVPEYKALKKEIDRIVGRINGRFSTSKWQPIHYLYNTVEIEELTALYRHAKVGVVTPLCDGMNLVSKEYCASQIDEQGALILSEFAGAADEFHEDAILVNPYDAVGTAEAMYQAVTMAKDECQRRMSQLRERVQTHDVFWWANQFVESLHEPTTLMESSEAEYLPTFDAPHRAGDKHTAGDKHIAGDKHSQDKRNDEPRTNGRHGQGAGFQRPGPPDIKQPRP
jgi:trehalose 6-phosphate synthase